MALLKFHTTQKSTRMPEERRESLAFGKLGEQLAARYLEDKGYIILEHNYRRGHLEIDLIALAPTPQSCGQPPSGKGATGELVIVEVKSRAADTLLQPEDAVDHKKRLALIRLANEYVKTHNRKENVRFDIVTILSTDHGAELNHLKNAYNVMTF
ncbi:MAG: YraN family protein [Bacteroidales bacterium]|nr:YraN family protein [Bacteroidales bacterium]